MGEVMNKRECLKGEEATEALPMDMWIVGVSMRLIWRKQKEKLGKTKTSRDILEVVNACRDIDWIKLISLSKEFLIKR